MYSSLDQFLKIRTKGVVGHIFFDHYSLLSPKHEIVFLDLVILLWHLRPDSYLYIYQLQVIIEGVAGLIYTADIAIDDISFSKNLTCVSAGRNTPSEMFEGNVQRWNIEEAHNTRDIVVHVILDRRDRLWICFN